MKFEESVSVRAQGRLRGLIAKRKQFDELNPVDLSLRGPRKGFQRKRKM